MSVFTPPAELTPALTEKRSQLLDLLRECGRVVVAFSGGVDSAVVAQGAFLAVGDRALAVTAISSSLATGEEGAAIELASRIGIAHRSVLTNEFQNPQYLANDGTRCYHCKTELYSQLKTQLKDWEDAIIVNGANLDDLGDYRPGLQAAREHGVRSPLVDAGITKAEVRELARAWQLSVAEKPAAPCLASRLAYGLPVTVERIERVDQAEQFLRSLCGLREFRVRHEFHDLARIEVSTEDLPRLLVPEVRQQITSRFRELGFKFVTLDLEGFRSGSLNTLLSIQPLAISPSPRS